MPSKDSDGRREIRTSGANLKKNVLDVIRILSSAPLASPDIKTLAKDAQAQEIAEAARIAMKENSSHLPTEIKITPEHEELAREKLCKERMGPLVKALDSHTRLEMQLAQARAQELLAKSSKSHISWRHSPWRAMAEMADSRRWKGAWRAIDEMDIRDKKEEINSRLKSLGDHSPLQRGGVDPRSHSGSEYESPNFEMPRFSYLDKEDIEKIIRKSEAADKPISSE